MHGAWTVKNTFVNVDDEDPICDMPRVGRLRSMSDPVATTASESDRESVGKDDGMLSDSAAGSTTDDEGGERADGQSDGPHRDFSSASSADLAEDQVSLPDTELDAADYSLLHSEMDRLMSESSLLHQGNQELRAAGFAPNSEMKGQAANVPLAFSAQPVFVFSEAMAANTFWFPTVPVGPQHPPCQASTFQSALQSPSAKAVDCSRTQPKLQAERRRVPSLTSDSDGDASCPSTIELIQRQSPLAKSERRRRAERNPSESRDETQSALAKEAATIVPLHQRTTVMLRNLPNNYTSSMVASLLDSQGFAGKYDFIYLPIDFSTCSCLGYAFVNMVQPEDALKLWDAFDGFSRWVVPSKKTCYVNWSDPTQGLQANVDRYRNSPVMHESVPEEFKPRIWRDGVRISFPPPTRKIRLPRLKRF